MNKTFTQRSKPLLALMLPILGTQLAQTGMGVVDTLVAGMAGTIDLAAIAVGSSIWIPIVLMVAGIMAAITPLAAHAKGAKNKALSAQILQQGLYLSLVIGLLCMTLLIYATRPVMEAMSVTPEIMGPTEDYLFYIAISLPAIAIYQALRSYNEAINITKPVTLIAVISLVLNIPLNIVFVLGFGWCRLRTGQHDHFLLGNHRFSDIYLFQPISYICKTTQQPPKAKPKGNQPHIGHWPTHRLGHICRNQCILCDCPIHRTARA